MWPAETSTVYSSASSCTLRSGDLQVPARIGRALDHRPCCQHRDGSVPSVQRAAHHCNVSCPHWLGVEVLNENPKACCAIAERSMNKRAVIVIIHVRRCRLTLSCGRRPAVERAMGMVSRQLRGVKRNVEDQTKARVGSVIGPLRRSIDLCVTVAHGEWCDVSVLPARHHVSPSYHNPRSLIGRQDGIDSGRLVPSGLTPLAGLACLACIQ